MQPSEPILGIIIRTFPSSDFDLVVRILTPEHGKIPAIAKGARRHNKRFPNGIDTLDRGTFRLTLGRGSLRSIESFVPTASFHTVRDSLHRIAAASLICEATDLLVAEENHPEAALFMILDQTLRHISALTDLGEILRSTHHALVALLVQSGFMDANKAPPASAKHFITLLDQLEHAAERPLLSKASALSLVDELRAAGSSR